jgi:hypothetical protein
MIDRAKLALVLGEQLLTILEQNAEIEQLKALAGIGVNGEAEDEPTAPDSVAPGTHYEDQFELRPEHFRSSTLDPEFPGARPLHPEDPLGLASF